MDALSPIIIIIIIIHCSCTIIVFESLQMYQNLCTYYTFFLWFKKYLIQLLIGLYKYNFFLVPMNFKNLI